MNLVKSFFEALLTFSMYFEKSIGLTCKFVRFGLSQPKFDVRKRVRSFS
jgi:hypothetical protein